MVSLPMMIRPQTVCTVNHNPKPSHTEQTDDDVIHVKDYYLTRHCEQKPCEECETEIQNDDLWEAEPLSHSFSTDDNDFETGHLERSFRIQGDIVMGYYSSEESLRNEIESLSGTGKKSDEEVVVPDYAYTDNNGIDMLMRFGTYSSSDESDHHTDSDKIKVPDSADIYKTGMDELMRFGLYESDDFDDQQVHLEDILQQDSPKIKVEVSPKFETLYQNNESCAAERHSQNFHEMDISVTEDEGVRHDSFSTDSSSIILYAGPRFHQHASYNFGEVETLDSEEESGSFGGILNLSESDNHDSDMVERHEEQRFNSSSSDGSIVVLYVGKRFYQTSYEFGEVETLDSDEVSNRTMSIPESDDKDVQEAVNSKKPVPTNACEDSLRKTTESSHDSRNSLEIHNEDGTDKADEKSGKERSVTTVSTAESKEKEDFDSNESIAKESMLSNKDDRGKHPKNSNSSSRTAPHKPQPRIHRRDILTGIARLFGKCFGKTIC